jgi:hypothetical protein
MRRVKQGEQRLLCFKSNSIKHLYYISKQELIDCISESFNIDYAKLFYIQLMRETNGILPENSCDRCDRLRLFKYMNQTVCYQ